MRCFDNRKNGPPVLSFKRCYYYIKYKVTKKKRKSFFNLQFILLFCFFVFFCWPIQQNTVHTMWNSNITLCWIVFLNAIRRVRNRGHFMTGTNASEYRLYEKLNLLSSEQHNSTIWIQIEREGWGEYCAGFPDSTRIGYALFPSEVLAATILCPLVLPCYLTFNY